MRSPSDWEAALRSPASLQIDTRPKAVGLIYNHQIANHVMKKNRTLMFLMLAFLSCSEKKQENSCRSLIISKYYENDCFSKEPMFKDSLYNLESLVTGFRFFFDSVNNAKISYHVSTVEDCNTTRFLSIQHNNQCTFIPFCDERLAIHNKEYDSSLIDENTLFAEELILFINDNKLKDPVYFIKSIFDSVFIANDLHLDYISFTSPDDSIKISEYVSYETNIMNYHTLGVSNGIWSIRQRADSIQIALLNKKLVKCYND